MEVFEDEEEDSNTDQLKSSVIKVLFIWVCDEEENYKPPVSLKEKLRSRKIQLNVKKYSAVEKILEKDVES